MAAARRAAATGRTPGDTAGRTGTARPRASRAAGRTQRGPIPATSGDRPWAVPELSELGERAFSQVKRTTPRLDDSELNAHVACVAAAITANSGSADWEVVVFEHESGTAFASPGRKIGIDRVMLGMTETQCPLATIIAHEVAHVLAEHANERLSGVEP